MKRFMKWVAVLAMMTLVISGLAACGGSSSEGGGTDTMKDPAAGNWYIVDGSDITTLKLDGTGGGSLGGDSISYSLDGDTVSLTIDGETIELDITEDINYGTVLSDGTDIFAFRDKAAAKDVAANGEIDKSQDTGIAESEPEESTPAASNPNAPYVGVWEGESFSYQGVDMSLADAEMTFSIEFTADGSVIATTNGEADGSANYVVNADGSATLTDPTGTLPENSYIDDSGILHLALDADDGTMWILCHKQ